MPAYCSLKPEAQDGVRWYCALSGQLRQGFSDAPAFDRGAGNGRGHVFKPAPHVVLDAQSVHVVVDGFAQALAWPPMSMMAFHSRTVSA